MKNTLSSIRKDKVVIKASDPETAPLEFKVKPEEVGEYEIKQFTGKEKAEFQANLPRESRGGSSKAQVNFQRELILKTLASKPQGLAEEWIDSCHWYVWEQLLIKALELNYLTEIDVKKLYKQPELEEPEI